MPGIWLDINQLKVKLTSTLKENTALWCQAKMYWLLKGSSSLSMTWGFTFAIRMTYTHDGDDVWTVNCTELSSGLHRKCNLDRVCVHVCKLKNWNNYLSILLVQVIASNVCVSASRPRFLLLPAPELPHICLKFCLESFHHSKVFLIRQKLLVPRRPWRIGVFFVTHLTQCAQIYIKLTVWR